MQSSECRAVSARTYVAHAAVHALRLAVRHARTVAAAAPLRALVLVRYRRRLYAKSNLFYLLNFILFL